MILSEIEISRLEKNIRAYYHIQNDLRAEITDNTLVLEEFKIQKVDELEQIRLEGEIDGLKTALNLIERAINDLEHRKEKAK